MCNLGKRGIYDNVDVTFICIKYRQCDGVYFYQ